MLLASSVICGLFTVITAVVICNSHILPSASVVIVLTAPTNRLGEIIHCISVHISLFFFYVAFIEVFVQLPLYTVLAVRSVFH